MKGAIITEQRKMESLARSYGSWGQTYNHVIENFNQTWIQNNMAKDMQDDFAIPYIAIFSEDTNYTTLYSNNERFGIAAKPSPSSISHLLIKFPTAGNSPQPKTQFIRDGDQIYMVTISKIIDSEKARAYALLALIKPVTEDYMDQISADYALANVDLVVSSGHADIGLRANLPIKQNDEIIGYMTWSPRESASKILKTLIPTGFVVILLLFLIGFLITQKIVKANTGYAKILQELAQSAEELIQAKEKSDRSSMAKTRFLSMMSHEIKTPMNGLMGMIALLKDTELNEVQIEYVNTMEISTESLLKLVDNILEYSKLESGEVSIMYGTINIRQMISEIHSLLLPISIQKRLKFETHFDDRVPIVIRSDAIRLRQVILHLVTNALKFTKVGSVRINVTSVDLGNARCELSIQIIDTGIGIPDGIKETLFQDFFQVDGEISRYHDGAGLGLSIVKNITTLLRAKVGVESKLGQGSVFWFKMEVEVITKLNINESNGQAPLPPTGPFIILLIEEEAPEGSYTRNLLEKTGNQVEMATNVAIAADRLNMEQYEAILIHIPENESLHGDFSPQTIKAAMAGKVLIPILGIAPNGDGSFDSKQYDQIITPPLTSSKLDAVLSEMIKSKQMS